MTEQLLNVNGLKVNVEDREILHGIDLQMNAGETHVLMGPNGAGKSTLGYALMGNPKFEITEGSIFLRIRILRRKRWKKGVRRHFPFLPESAGGAGDFPGQFYPQRVGEAQGRKTEALGFPEGNEKGHGGASDG